MPLYDPLASQFANAPLAPWQKSKKLFDFDDGFVAYIRKYLEARKLVSDVVAAKAWINKAKFGDGERYELCTLQWEAYQESTEPKPILRAVDGDCELSGGGADGASKPDLASPLDAVVTDLPAEFAKQEGETPEAYRKRMFESIQKNIKKVGNW